MRTLIMLGIAASAVLAVEHAAAAELPMTRGVNAASLMVAAGHKQKRTAPLDYGTGYPGDARVYSGGADRYPVEGEYRRVDDVDYQGRWTGTWDGAYETRDGRVYEGQYHGTYDGAAGTDYAPPPHGGYAPTQHGGGYAEGYRYGVEQQYGGNAYGFDPREDARLARLCRDDGVGGAAIGAIAGGIAGNRIAGRGNRLGGTLIGAGVGGILGTVIDQGEDRARCNAWRAWRRGHSQTGYSGGGYPGGPYPGGYPVGTPYPGAPYPHGTTVHHGGYGYYSPGVVVTTIINQPAPVVTTETVTTTTTHYETIYVQQRARHVPKKRYHKPRPKPRCTC